jgi:hypothetical protein
LKMHGQVVDVQEHLASSSIRVPSLGRGRQLTKLK